MTLVLRDLNERDAIGIHTPSSAFKNLALFSEIVLAIAEERGKSTSQRREICFRGFRGWFWIASSSQEGIASLWKGREFRLAAKHLLSSEWELHSKTLRVCRREGRKGASSWAKHSFA